MRLPVAKDGLPIILVGVLLTAVAAQLAPWLAWALGSFTLFCVYFFRDPERELPAGDGLVVSPADGTVIDIRDVEEPEFFKGPARRVSIFMSIWSVHVNRAPVAGRVTWLRYNPGTFALAWRDKASELNEQNSVGMVRGDAKIVVRQIAGWVARRIVCWVRPEQELAAGERLGLIRFGSRVDLFLPRDGVEVRVQVGQKVFGGSTVIGAFR